MMMKKNKNKPNKKKMKEKINQPIVDLRTSKKLMKMVKKIIPIVKKIMVKENPTTKKQKKLNISLKNQNLKKKELLLQEICMV